MKTVEIYTDGACKGNPGKGGWGVVLIYGQHQKTMFGGEPSTTNNIMELTAVIKGLEALKEKCHVRCYSDSQYVVNGMTTWIHNWKKKGWKGSTGKPVLNELLWKQLDELCQFHNVEFIKVKGHSGHPLNDLADELANRGCNG